MFVTERPSLLAAVELLLPLAGAGAVCTVAAEEPDRLVCTVASRAGGVRSVGLGRILLPGAVTLPLAPLARALKCGTGACRVEVASNGTAAAVAIDPDGATGRKFTFALDGAAPPPDWPVPGPDRTAAELPAAAFADLVTRTAFAARRSVHAGTWETRGVLLGVGPGRVTCSASDAIVYATASAPAETLARQKGRALLVPAATARAWAKAAKQGETVRVVLTDAAATFGCGPVSAWAAPLAGLFPAPEALPAAPPHALTVPTGRLLTELAAALAAADAAEPTVALASRPGALALTTASARTRVSVTVPVPGAAAPFLRVDIDGGRLAEVVRTWRAEPTLSLGYGTDREPIVLSAGDCRAVLAPHRPRDA